MPPNQFRVMTVNESRASRTVLSKDEANQIYWFIFPLDGTLSRIFHYMPETGKR